ncbi:MAG TPA: hypothetical protein VKM55_24390 [Candidatus Lokiarchaeia archaeon]|nr:hypothetical protein [Candidatus Lokiarchaeia archaeon]
MKSGTDTLDEQTFNDQLGELLAKKAIPSEKAICAVINTYLLNTLGLESDGTPPQYLFHYLFIYLKVQLNNRYQGGLDYFPIDLTNYLVDHPAIMVPQVHPKGSAEYNFDSARKHPILFLEESKILEVIEDTSTDLKGHRMIRINPDRMHELKSIVDRISQTIDAFWKKMQVRGQTLESKQEPLSNASPETIQVPDLETPVVSPTSTRYHDEWYSRMYDIQELILGWVKFGKISLQNILEANDADIIDVSNFVEAAMHFKEQQFSSDLVSVLDNPVIVNNIVKNSDVKDVVHQIEYLDMKLGKLGLPPSPFTMQLAAKLVTKLVSASDIDALWQYRDIHSDVILALFSSLLAKPDILVANLYMFMNLLSNSNIDQAAHEKAIDFGIQKIREAITKDDEYLDDYIEIVIRSCNYVLPQAENDVRSTILQKLYGLVKDALINTEGYCLQAILGGIMACIKYNNGIDEVGGEIDELARLIGIAINNMFNTITTATEHDTIESVLDTVDFLLDISENHDIWKDVSIDIDDRAIAQIYQGSSSWPFTLQFQFLRMLKDHFHAIFIDAGGSALYIKLLQQFESEIDADILESVIDELDTNYNPRQLYRYIKRVVDTTITSPELKNRMKLEFNPNVSSIMNYSNILKVLKSRFHIDDNDLLKKIVSLKDFPTLLRRSDETGKYTEDLSFIEYVFKDFPGLIDADIVAWLVNHEEIRAYIAQEGYKHYDQELYDLLESIVPGSFNQLITPEVFASTIDIALTRDYHYTTIFDILRAFMKRYPSEFNDWKGARIDTIQDILFNSFVEMHGSIVSYLDEINTIFPDALSLYFDYERFIDSFVNRWNYAWCQESASDNDAFIRSTRDIVFKQRPDKITEYDQILERMNLIKTRQDLFFYPRKIKR